MAGRDADVTMSELQVLVSMYDKSQIHFDDTHLAAKLESLICANLEDEDEDGTVGSLEVGSPSSLVRSTTSLTVRPSEQLKIDIRIPLGYHESEKLSAHCRIVNNKASPEMEDKLNQELTSRVRNSEPGLSILELIDFCKEVWERLELSTQRPAASFGSNSTPGESNTDEEDNRNCRVWIHSHHIYNKHKRKFLVETADQLNLSGISCPGKPGFVCVEGREEDCDEYWTRVRQLTWQKINLISKEVNIKLVFPLTSFEELRCDKSQFIKYLEERNLSAVIKNYLGFS